MAVPPPTAASRGLRAYLLVLLVALALAATVLGGLALGGLRGAWQMTLSATLVALGWLGFAAWSVVTLARGWGRGQDPFLRSTRWWLTALVWWAPVVGLPLAFLAFVNCGPLWVPDTFHWSGLAMTVAGLAALYSLPLVAGRLTGARQEAAGSRRWWVVAVHCGTVALLWGLAWLVPYAALLRDRVDSADYAGATSGYLLPWPGGQDGWVIQGNDAGLNHNNDHLGQKFAWDFRRECGTPVLAARAGQVTRVTDTNDGIGGDNNEVEVTHADGSVAAYLHVAKGSAVVAVGSMAAQGDPLADVGCVGNSLTGHVHFHVRSGGPTVAIRFDDVDDDGIPRSFGSYTSGNR